MESTNPRNNRYFINDMPRGERDVEDGGSQGMDRKLSAAEIQYKADLASSKARTVSPAVLAANTLNARRCKEVDARSAAMKSQLGRALKNSEMDTIRWQVGKEIK